MGATLGGYNRGLLLLTPGFTKDLEVAVPPWVILVSREGRRFASEMAPYTVMAGLFKRNGSMAYAIFDEAARLDADSMPVGPSWTSENLLARAESGEVLRADTLEELAGLCKINAAPLAGTVQKYNADCARGVDTAYFKPMGLRPIETPPFYALEVRPAIIAWTGCGLRVDSDTHVIANTSCRSTTSSRRGRRWARCTATATSAAAAPTGRRSRSGASRAGTRPRRRPRARV